MKTNPSKDMDMNRTAPITIAIGLVAALSASAAQVEQVEDLNLHTVQPASGSSTLWKAGIGFDGGDGMVLMKWDILDAGFSNSLNTVFLTLIENAVPPANGDGSMSVHRMLVDWDETSTNADFGGGLPQPGVHYQALPLTTAGFNKEPTGIGGVPNGNRDDVELNALVNWWKNNPSMNFGIALVPRGQINANYPVAFDAELKGQSREALSGTLDSNDQRLEVSSSGVKLPPTVLKPSDDTAVAENVPDNMARRNFSSTSLFPNAGSRNYSLYRFEFGSLFLDGADPADFDFSSATFRLGLRGDGVGGDEGTVGVHEMLVPWSEATATWNQFGAGGPQAGIDYDATPVATFPLAGGQLGLVDVEITALANKWLDDQADNHGIILIVTSTTGDWGNNIAPSSSETNLGWYNGAEDSRLEIAFAVVVPTPDITVVSAGETSAIVFESQAGIRYGLASRTGAGPFADTGARLVGDGGIMQFFDPDGFDPARDYKVLVR